MQESLTELKQVEKTLNGKKELQRQVVFANGNVLGKYQLGISDVWISNRIDKMLEEDVYKRQGQGRGL